MVRTLTRSKSLRFLRGNHQKQEYEDPTLPPKASQTELDRYFTASPILKAGGNLEAPDVEIRPSTSDGFGDRTTMFHLKSINPSPSIHSHDTVFDFPSRSKSPTFLYTAEVTAGSGVIGIALGSPTVGSHWNTTSQTSPSNLGVQTEKKDMDANHSNKTWPCESSREEPPKPKISRWKSLFRKAALPPPSPQEKPAFYQLVTTVTAAGRADSHHDGESVRSQASTRQEGFGRITSPPPSGTDTKQSRKAGIEESATPRPLTRGRAATLGASPTIVSHGAISASANDEVVMAGTLLDVTIPDIKMERYSVMFSSLLQSNTYQSSSLLLRRQGTAEKLKPLNELSIKDEQKSPMNQKVEWRGTSPTVVSPSPRLSLFPSANSSRTSSPRTASATRAGKALQRSRTAPAKSPLRQTFAQTTLAARPKRVDSITFKPITVSNVTPTIASAPVKSFESVTGLAPRPLNITKEDSDGSADMVIPPIATKAIKEQRYPPRTDSQRLPHVTKMSALSSHPSSAPPDITSPLQQLQSLSSPPVSARETRASAGQSSGKLEVQSVVGVARSVSVSRANRPRQLARTMTDSKITRSASSERLVERRSLTPTMVEVRNRQSQQVQMVDV